MGPPLWVAPVPAEIPPEWDPDGDGKGGGGKNITVPKAYNELATLISVPGKPAEVVSGQQRVWESAVVKAGITCRWHAGHARLGRCPVVRAV